MSLVETKSLFPGKAVREQIDFNEVLQQAINSLAFMDGFSTVRFKSSVHVMQDFYGDKLLIVPIVQHLIHNAIRYRKESIPDAQVKITLEDDSQGVKIIVSDNGIGISGNIQESIVSMFSRATDKIPGHGLGLYTVNHCIRKLDGQISLDSKEGMGTTVKVWVRNEGK
jgi:signal transduction histidine kinase